MNLMSSQGLLAGIDQRLTADETNLLESAFSNLEIEPVALSGRFVASPGFRILRSYHDENGLSDEVRDLFQEKLITLLRGVRSGSPPDVPCCPYHRGKLREIVPFINPLDGTWLLTFLEVLTAITEDIHFQLRSSIGTAGDPNVSLSRMMPLETFITSHTKCYYSAALKKDFIKVLSPLFGQRARLLARTSGALPKLWGRIGTYPNRTAALGASVHQYRTYCERVKPFATLTEKITAENDRTGAPDRLLKGLGLTFGPGNYWIELVYSSEDACFVSEDVRVGLEPEHESYLGIPTRLESAGNWAFQPDRDSPPRTNFALDLMTDKRGGPEIIHERLDPKSLQDLIVWGKPTESDWSSYPDSPLLA